MGQGERRPLLAERLPVPEWRHRDRWPVQEVQGTARFKSAMSCALVLKRASLCGVPTAQVVSGTAPTSWTTVRRNSAKSLASALTQQPVSVAVGASKDWMYVVYPLEPCSTEKSLLTVTAVWSHQQVLQGGDLHWQVRGGAQPWHPGSRIQLQRPGQLLVSRDPPAASLDETGQALTHTSPHVWFLRVVKNSWGTNW